MSETKRRIRRAVRWFTLGCGPLKRGTDRVQALARVTLLTLFLATAPVGLWAGALTQQHLTVVAAEQASARHRIDAVLLQDAVGSAQWDTASDTATSPTPARWTTPQGMSRVGQVAAAVGSRAGHEVPVWTAADGSLTTAPLDRQSILAQSVAVGVSTAVGVGLAGWAGYGLVCWRLGRRRDRQWTTGWATVAPVWRTQLH